MGKKGVVKIISLFEFALNWASFVWPWKSVFKGNCLMRFFFFSEKRVTSNRSAFSLLPISKSRLGMSMLPHTQLNPWRPRGGKSVGINSGERFQQTSCTTHSNACLWLDTKMNRRPAFIALLLWSSYAKMFILIQWGWFLTDLHFCMYGLFSLRVCDLVKAIFFKVIRK